MDRRWAPAGAAAAVAAVVGAVALALGSDGPPQRVATLPAPSAAVSSAASPAPSRPAETSPAPRPSATHDPDVPASSDDPPEATPSPGRPSNPPRPTPSPRATREASPAAARATFGFDAAYGTDEPYEVVVQYGDSSSCPHARVTHVVRESAEQVVVTLEADAMDPGRACTADYRQVLVPVRLERPLGDRVVVDGHRGEPVPVDRACRRPFADPPPQEDCTA